MKALSTPGDLQRITKDCYHCIRRKVRKIQKNVQESISRDNLTIKQVSMFSIHARIYIIVYKLISHRKILAGLDIDLFIHIYVERIYNVVKYFKTHRCALEFVSLFLAFLQKKKINKSLVYNL